MENPIIPLTGVGELLGLPGSTGRTHSLSLLQHGNSCSSSRVHQELLFVKLISKFGHCLTPFLLLKTAWTFCPPKASSIPADIS